MKVLVIGCGYVGSELLQLLRYRGFEVFGVSFGKEAAQRLSVALGLAVFSADVGDEGALGKVATEVGEVDVVVHCASSGRGGAEAYERVFVEGARNMRRVFPGAKLVFTSSTSVYAQVDGGWVTEDAPTEPVTEGGVLLLRAEGSILSDPRGVVVRLAGIYGPGRCHALKVFFEGRAAVEGEGEGRWMNAVHRDDAVGALIHVLEHDLCGIYQVADGNPMTQQRWLENLRGRFGGVEAVRRQADPTRKRGWSNKRISVAKLRCAGWEPVYASMWEKVVHDCEWVEEFRRGEGGPV